MEQTHGTAAVSYCQTVGSEIKELGPHSPEHNLLSRRSVEWCRTGPVRSSGPLPCGRDSSGHFPGSIPAQRKRNITQYFLKFTALICCQFGLNTGSLQLTITIVHHHLPPNGSQRKSTQTSGKHANSTQKAPQARNHLRDSGNMCVTHDSNLMNKMNT